MTFYKPILAGALFLMLSVAGSAQDPSSAAADAPTSDQAPSAQDTESERWNLYFQATSIGDYHGTFHSPYEGPLSLQDYLERDVSLTTTLFFTAAPGTGYVSGLRSGDRGRKGFQRRERDRRSAKWRNPARRQRHAQAVHRAPLHPARFRIRHRKRSVRRATKISSPASGR